MKEIIYTQTLKRGIIMEEIQYFMCIIVCLSVVREETVTQDKKKEID